MPRLVLKWLLLCSRVAAPLLKAELRKKKLALLRLKSLMHVLEHPTLTLFYRQGRRW